MPQQVDVAVVGAGFSGLSAARELAAAGRSVAVIEARDRVGGRVESRDLDGAGVADLGAQWTGPGQDAIQGLASEFGVGLVPLTTTGRDYRYLAGREIGDDDPMWRALESCIAAIAELEQAIPDDGPWAAPHAREWDAATFGAWLDDHNHDSAARALLNLVIDAYFACPPSEMSLLHGAWYGRLKGGFSQIIVGKDTHQFEGGVQSLAIKLAASLGEAVHLGHPVRTIEQGGEQVVVHADGLVIEADRVILALPPALSAAIVTDPPMPAWRALLCQRAKLGSGYKVTVVYDEPFWRAEGWSGWVTDDRGPVVVSLNATPPDGSRGILVGFMPGSASYPLEDLAPDERRRRSLDCFVRWFGPQAAKPLAYVERMWATEQWSRGDITTFGPGFWTTFGPRLAEPVGRIHFAGTETADRFPSEMEGAVRAGVRAAREVVERQS